MWTNIIYNPNNQPVQKTSSKGENTEKKFTEHFAEGLYNELQHALNQANSKTQRIEFKELQGDEKLFWISYADKIPDKFKSLSLFVRPFQEFCRTCLITDPEISELVKIDNDYFTDLPSNSPVFNHYTSGKNTGLASLKSENILSDDRESFFLELNFLIPAVFKKAGYEIIRHEEALEIDMSTIRKVARAIHSRYLREIKKQGNSKEEHQENYLFFNPGDSGNKYHTDFEALPEEIKQSNIDNAAHIPTKLLSIGYKIRHVKKGFKPAVLHLDEEEIETMAEVEHMRWSWEKRLTGWRYGKSRDNAKKIHPSLIPFDELSDSEKEKDRELVKLIPSFLQDIDYEVYPVSPNRISKLSYAIKPQSHIQKLLNETRRLGDEVSSLAAISPEIHEKIISINNKIEETIREVQGSYNYARYIQEIFLPEDLYIRECFPESFILYKPKNIVSGDFYFFSKRGDLILFALADCTGHGIPGALISTIGYGSLDQVVNVKKNTDPALILRNLYTLIHRFLRRNLNRYGMHDDMDITMCVLDTRTDILTYSGIGNLFFHLSGSEISEIKSDYFKAHDDDRQEYRFKSASIQMKIGDTLYLSSDGYTDQFGGQNHKKYSRKRLMDYLLSISDYPMTEQSDRLNEEIERWKGDNDEEQIDDISVIGIRI